MLTASFKGRGSGKGRAPAAFRSLRDIKRSNLPRANCHCPECGKQHTYIHTYFSRYHHFAVPTSELVCVCVFWTLLLFSPSPGYHLGYDKIHGPTRVEHCLFISADIVPRNRFTLQPDIEAKLLPVGCL